MYKKSDLNLEDIELRGSSNIRDPRTFLIHHLPEVYGFEDFFETDISSFGGDYGTIYDIYIEYVDKMIKEGSVIPPQIQGIEKLDDFENQIEQLKEALQNLEKENPVAFDVIYEAIMNDKETNQEEFLEKMQQSYDEGIEEEENDPEFDKFSSVKTASNITKKPSSSKSLELLKKVSPIEGYIALRYLEKVHEDLSDSAKGNLAFGTSSYLSTSKIMAIEAELGALGISELIAAFKTGTAINLAIGMAKDIVVESLIEMLAPFIIGAISFIFSMLAFLGFDALIGVFDFDAIPLILTILAEIALSVGIAFLGAGAITLGLRFKKYIDMFKKIKKAISMLKEAYSKSKVLNNKVKPVGEKCANVIRKFAPREHRKICEEVAKEIKVISITADDVDNILKSSGALINKKNNLKILELKRFLIKNGFIVEANMIWE